ncbi:carboxypeptidase-like regulatory domain-containing protein [Schaalia sp. lx-260]|uniref:carboxypeptidase-like regulatory domain-containing protein n=1 Tax=Schaalia sp. lx-260 TaxID=2899082 RepID=UPI001E52786B|nr:carboxypeptidase-like regulatory domain-containing protein [Schaalia sp. lx-260]MCD4549580.1 carboxypeptidase-like regulatory domain-containing protein [Schaalia sp. lx-260]
MKILKRLRGGIVAILAMGLLANTWLTQSALADTDDENAATTGPGVIEATVNRVINPLMDENNTLLKNTGSTIAELGIPRIGEPLAVSLLDGTGTVLETKTLENGVVRFDNLPYGTYKLRISRDFAGITDYLLQFPATTANRIDNGVRQQILEDESPAIEVTQSNPEHTEQTDSSLAWYLIYNMVGASVRSEIGHYGDNETTKSATIFPDGGGLIVDENAGETRALLNGILYASSLNSMKLSLAGVRPTLSPAEQAYGYKFVGWTLDQETEKLVFPEGSVSTETQGIYDDASASSIVVRPGSGDLHYRAVWSYPVNKMNFVTEQDKGTLTAFNETGVTATYPIEGNVDSIASKGWTLPTVQAKPGYKFVGWIADLSMNVISDDEILNRKAFGTRTLYAKFVPEAAKPTVSFEVPGDYGSLTGTTDLVKEIPLPEAGNSLNAAGVTTLPQVTPKEGYEFLGWFDTPALNVVPDNNILSTPHTADHRYIAKFKKIESGEPKKHNVTFDPREDGELPGESMISLKEGSYIPELPMVNPKPGKKFVGWRDVAGVIYPDAFSLIARNIVNGDLKFEAVYEDMPILPQTGGQPEGHPVPTVDGKPVTDPAAQPTDPSPQTQTYGGKQGGLAKTGILTVPLMLGVLGAGLVLGRFMPRRKASE